MPMLWCISLLMIYAHVGPAMRWLMEIGKIHWEMSHVRVVLINFVVSQSRIIAMRDCHYVSAMISAETATT